LCRQRFCIPSLGEEDGNDDDNDDDVDGDCDDAADADSGMFIGVTGVMLSCFRFLFNRLP
jgi:hypothetical protein